MAKTESFRVLAYDIDPTISATQNKQSQNEYIITNDSASSCRRVQMMIRRDKRMHWALFFSSIFQVGKDLFLPIGFPHSVEPNYLQYQFYDSIQGLSSYLRGVVTTSAVLHAAGVGSSSADALSAAMAWATRDGIGMIGGLLFSYAASPFFDAYVKEFRLFADVINDVGLTLDMAAPLFPSAQILLVSCVATICKVMCGMAAGATKASITAHFAKRGNMADLNAKESTQESLMTLVGMSLGILLAKQLRNLGASNNPDAAEERKSDAITTWAVFLILTILHVWANYRGVTLLKLKTLNKKRAQAALQRLIKECSIKIVTAGKVPLSILQNQSEIELLRNMILSPNEISESILPNIILLRKLRLGVNISDIFVDNNDAIDAFHLFRNEKYVLWLRNKAVYVALRCGANQNDELKAFLHALIIQKCELGSNTACNTRIKNFVDILYGEEEVFLNILRSQGWDVDNKLYLDFGRPRFDCITKDN